MGPSTVAHVRQLLWSMLGELEELSPATSSVVQLLSHLYAQPGSSSVGDELGALVPLLWPFLRHNLSGVRLATSTCLERLLAASRQQGNAGWLKPITIPLLRLTFQQLLVEGDERVVAAAMRVWELLLQCSPPQELAAGLAAPSTATATTAGAPTAVPTDAAAARGSAAAAPPTILHMLLSLAATPNGLVLDASSLLVALEGGDIVTAAQLQAMNRTKAGAASAPGGNPTPAAKRARRGTRETVTAGASQQQGGSQGATSAPTPTPGSYASRAAPFVVGSLGEGSATRMRMLACQALGPLCCWVSGKVSQLPWTLSWRPFVVSVVLCGVCVSVVVRVAVVSVRGIHECRGVECCCARSWGLCAAGCLENVGEIVCSVSTECVLVLYVFSFSGGVSATCVCVCVCVSLVMVGDAVVAMVLWWGRIRR